MKRLLYLLGLLVFVLQSNANSLWIRYPSISPDGKTIVFSYQGDLFTVASSGGEAKILTTHLAHDYHPIWSPDGTKIAFASNRFGNFDIFLIDAKGGIPERITNFSGNEVPTDFSPEGKEIIYSALIQDIPENVQFPYSLLSELYSVNIQTKDIRQVLSTPAVDAKYSADGTKIIYHDIKGYEDNWRKHQKSSIARDIWEYDINTSKHTQLTNFEGEDRTPVYANNKQDVYFLSEQFGTFNVCKINANNPKNVEQITSFTIHPVRFLSISNDETLCFTYNSQIYIKKKGQETQSVDIKINSDNKSNEKLFTRLSNISEMEVSPSGKEIVFVSRGEVFVTSTDYATTKQITNTPEQERSVSFSPDGKSILYASERNGSWNLYQTKIVNEEEKLFTLSTLLKEEEILVSDKETFQPRFSPSGEEVAFLEQRVILRVINLKTKAIRTIVDDSYRNYSYSDGDQNYDWSPDGKWFLVQYSPNQMFFSDIGLIKADGTGKMINLTNSGYDDVYPRWMMNGEMMIWSSDREGYRSHGSWGADRDVFAMFFTKEAYDKFKMTEEEYKNYKQEEDEKEKNKKAEDKKEKDKKEKDELKPIKIDFDYIEDRKVRLTINSSKLSDAVISPDGEKMYYLSRFEKGADLWEKDLRKNETKLLMKMDGYYGSIFLVDKGKKLIVSSGGKIYNIDVKKKSKKLVSHKATMNLDKKMEKQYIFEHIWRQVNEKFYVADLHGVDWKLMKENYSKFIPSINNNFDFSEMLSEMLGELNGSHTGARYYHRDPNADQTAALGVFWDWNYTGKGVRIVEIINKSPFDNAKSKVKVGSIITKINGEEINNLYDYFDALNHTYNKNTAITILDNGNTWNETIKPISIGKQNRLLYQRWVKNRMKEVEKLSNGQIGYVHVAGMNSNSFREFFSELLGRNYYKKAIIVDTRFNGGGWLHDDLATTLSGKTYTEFNIRGKKYGNEPINKWRKPSAVLVGEGNYSDAYGFPYAYQTLKIGNLIGMPIAGTMTAVWWERLQDPSLVFGIPQVGMKDLKGNYLENKQIEPDVKVKQDYEIVIKNRDQQIEKAVEVLLKKVNK